jgi:hypothetical protein
MWRFVNDSVKNSLGQSSSFEIMPGETVLTLLPSSDWPQSARASPSTASG